MIQMPKKHTSFLAITTVTYETQVEMKISISFNVVSR